MNRHSTLFQTLSEKLPTTHPVSLLAPLAVAAWLVTPVLAPGDTSHPVAPNPVQAGLDAARNTLMGDKSVGGAPLANANVPAGTTPGTASVVAGNRPVSTATQRVIVLPPGGSQPSAPAPAANRVPSGGPTSGSNYGGKSSTWASTAKPQMQTPVQMQAPAPEASRVTQPIIITPPAFRRPPAPFPRPLMPWVAYRGPMMGRSGVTSFGGRRR
jgi:hypothetical protein